MQVFNAVDADKIISNVLSKSKEVLNNLNRESIDVYRFLMAEFAKSDVTTNMLFQFVFRSYYRLDNAGLTAELKRKYFELMQQNRSLEFVDLKPILRSLYDLPTLKDLNSFQFSFTTKLINTIDSSYPIYDSEVAKGVIGTDYRPSGDFEKKLIIYLERHEIIKKTYAHILEFNSFESVFSDFDISFPENKLPEIKKLDFIFWSYGKLL